MRIRILTNLKGFKKFYYHLKINLTKLLILGRKLLTFEVRYKNRAPRSKRPN